MRFAQLVNARRAMLLAALNRRDFDRPAVHTNFAVWPDMVVTFSEERDVSSAEVVVDDEIDIVILTSRLQALLEYTWGPGASTITYSTSIEKYGSVAKVRAVTCDQIVKRTTGETLGRMRPRARGLAAGMITVTIRDYSNSLSFECSNSARGRLFGAWMAIVTRLDQLKKAREPRPEDARLGFMIWQETATGLWLVRNETWVLGQPPALLLYAEGNNGIGAFFNGAGEYPADDETVSVADVIPVARQIMTQRPAEEPESS